MSRRFYCPQSLTVSRLTLGPAETHHLVRVLRARVGEEVVLFDGEGLEALAVLVAVNDRAELEIRETRAAGASGTREIVLATAVPKGDRFGWLVEKAVELGVTRLQPLRTKRSVVDPGTGKLERMRQVVVAASKQCGRARLMEVAETVDWGTFLDALPSEVTVLLGDPSGEAWDTATPGGSGDTEAARAMILCVGPEGGFTPEEVESAIVHGARLVSLGPNILRVETAGLVLSTLAMVK